MSDFYDNPFDRAFKRVLVYLIEKKKIDYQEFCGLLEVDKTVISNILADRRKLPKHKRDLATKVLTGKKYGVNPEFLKTNTGQILTEAVLIGNKDIDIEYLIKENGDLREKNDILNQLNKQQAQLIESLNELLKKSAKKPAK